MMKKDSDPATRLEQRSEERTSLSRGSFGKGSLTGRFSLTGAIAGPGAGGPSSYLGGSDAVSLGGSSAATRHWVNSVSDIYGPDEIEELLEDLNRLELAAGASFTDDEEPVVADLGYAVQRARARAAQQEAPSETIHIAPEGNRLRSLDSGAHAHRPHHSPPSHARTTNRKKHTALSDPLTGDQMLIEGWGHDTCDNQDVVARVRLPPSPVTDRHDMAEDVPMRMIHHAKAMKPSARASPTFSVRSWDSHVHYQHDEDDHPSMADGADEDPGGLFLTRSKESVACYCDIATFKNPRTLLRVLLVVSEVAESHLSNERQITAIQCK